MQGPTRDVGGASNKWAIRVTHRAMYKIYISESSWARRYSDVLREYFRIQNTVRRYLLAQTEKSLQKPRSGFPVSWQRFEPKPPK